MITIPEPVQTWLDSFSALKLVLTIGAIYWVARMIWGTVKKSLPGMKRAIAFIEALFKLPQFMASTEAKMESQATVLETVKHEVLPNNGGSMRDELTTLGYQVDKVTALQEKDYVKIQNLEAVIAQRVLRARNTRTGSVDTVEVKDDGKPDCP